MDRNSSNNKYNNAVSLTEKIAVIYAKDCLRHLQELIRFHSYRLLNHFHPSLIEYFLEIHCYFSEN